MPDQFIAIRRDYKAESKKVSFGIYLRSLHSSYISSERLDSANDLPTAWSSANREGNERNIPVLDSVLQ